MRKSGEEFGDFRQQGESRDVSADTPKVRYKQRGEPGWKRFLQFVLVTLVLTAATFLLIAGESRRRLVAGLAQQWVRASWSPAGTGAEVFKLPPPPPKTAQPKILRPYVPVVAEPTLVLYDEGTAATAGKEPEKKGYVAPPKTPESERAHDLLLEKSATVNRLAGNRDPQYQYQEWRLLKSGPPEFWIEFIALRESDGQQLHLIWAINMESGAVRPLSQAARDLEQAAAKRP